MISIFVNNASEPNKQRGNQVTVSFNPPIILNPKKKYQMRCLNANIVNCMPNITSSNNKLYFNIGNPSNPDLWRTFTFDTGLYSLRDTYRAISMFTSDSSNGNDPKLIQFSADQATSKIYAVFNYFRSLRFLFKLPL